METKQYRVVMLPKTQEVNQKDIIQLNFKGGTEPFFAIASEHANSISKEVQGSIKPQNLYIISDEPIKASDWFLSDERNNLTENNGKPIWILLQCDMVQNGWIYAKGRLGETFNIGWTKKVIATTDDLHEETANGYNYGSRVDKIPTSYVKWYVEKANDSGVPVDYVRLEMKPDGFCSIQTCTCKGQEVIDCLYDGNKIKTTPDGYVIPVDYQDNSGYTWTAIEWEYKKTIDIETFTANHHCNILTWLEKNYNPPSKK